VFAVKPKGEDWKIGAVPPPQWKEKPPEDAVVWKDFKEVYPNLPAGLKLSFLNYAMQYAKLLKKDVEIVEEKMSVEEAILLKYQDDPEVAEILLKQVGDNTVVLALGAGGSFARAVDAKEAMEESKMSTRKADSFIRGCVKHELARSKRRLQYEETKIAALATLIELRDTKLSASSAQTLLQPYAGTAEYEEAEKIAAKRLEESYEAVKRRADSMPKFGGSIR